jgi:hypothetical protein
MDEEDELGDQFQDDEEAGGDFKNFDPSKYMRNRGSSSSSAGEQSTSDDFENFDPSKYVRKRRAEVGQSGYGDPSVPRSRGRGRRRGTTGDDGIEDAVGGVALGLGGRFAEYLRPENARMFSSILTEARPILRPILLGIGCILVLACGGLCLFGYSLITALTRR